MGVLYYSRNQYGHYWSEAGTDLLTLLTDVYKSDLNIPAVAPGRKGLHLIVRTGADGQAVGHVILPSGKKAFQSSPIQIDLTRGTLCGVGISALGPGASASDELLLAANFKNATAAKSSICLYNVNDTGAATQTGILEYSVAGELGPPQIIVHRDLVWVFHFDPASPAGGPYTVACAIFKYSGQGSGMVELFSGPIHEGGTDGETVTTKFPVSVAIHLDIIHLAMVRQSARLAVIRKKVPRTGPSQKDEALTFSHHFTATSPQRQTAIDSTTIPVAPLCGAGLCDYDGLLHLIYQLKAPPYEDNLYELTYDGHTFGAQKLFENHHYSNNVLCATAHDGGMFAFYHDAGPN